MILCNLHDASPSTLNPMSSPPPPPSSLPPSSLPPSRNPLHHPSSRPSSRPSSHPSSRPPLRPSGHGYRPTHAIGTLTARITAKLSRRQPAKKLLTTIQNNWTRIAPEDFFKHATPTHLSQSPANTTLTISVEQAFAPIALHRTTQLLNNINAFLGSNSVQSVKLQQTNSPP